MENIGVFLNGVSSSNFITLGTTANAADYYINNSTYRIVCDVKQIRGYGTETDFIPIIGNRAWAAGTEQGYCLTINGNDKKLTLFLSDATNAVIYKSTNAFNFSDSKNIDITINMVANTVTLLVNGVSEAITKTAGTTWPVNVTATITNNAPRLLWATTRNAAIALSNLYIYKDSVLVSRHDFNANMYDLSGNGRHAVPSSSDIYSYWGICSCSSRPIYASQADINGGLVFKQGFTDMLDIERNNGRMTGIGARCSITGGLEFTGGVPVIEYRCSPSMYAALPKPGAGIFTIMAKGVYKAGTTADQVLFTISQYSNTSPSFECVIDVTTKKLKIGSTLLSETVAVADTLFHCALVVDIAGLDIKCYINGVLDKTTTGQGLLANYYPERLTVGAQPNKTSEKFYGCLGDMRIYKGALTVAQINKIITDGTL